MQLDDNELLQLAGFMARRFSDPAERAALARAVGVESPPDGSEASWFALLSAAQARGRLPGLVAEAARLRPDDDRLAELRMLLPRTWRGGLAALAVVVLIGVGYALLTREPAPEAAALEPSAAAPTAEPPLSAAPAVQEVEPSAATPAPVAATPEPTPAPVAATPAPSPAPVASTASAAEQGVLGSCTGPQGALIGWWYSGGAPPGSQGQTITMTRAATVRADYPREENGFDYKRPIRCHLKAGDRLLLSGAPVSVPGNAFWTPVHGGDLQR